eukprot:scaffold2028_cov191-Amphora_coffeaeformis.AAC.5
MPTSDEGTGSQEGVGEDLWALSLTCVSHGTKLSGLLPTGAPGERTACIAYFVRKMKYLIGNTTPFRSKTLGRESSLHSIATNHATTFAYIWVPIKDRPQLLECTIVIPTIKALLERKIHSRPGQYHFADYWLFAPSPQQDGATWAATEMYH